MKEIPYTAAPLVGESGQKSGLRQILFGHLAGNAYYEAHSEDNGIYILWMEFSRFGQLRAYPCVLHERDCAPLVFMPHPVSEPDDRNRTLLQRWEVLITPERFRSFSTSSLEKDAFQKIYRAYRSAQA